MTAVRHTWSMRQRDQNPGVWGQELFILAMFTDGYSEDEAFSRVMKESTFNRLA